MQKNNEFAKTKKTTPLVFMLHCLIGILFCLILVFVFSLLISSEKISPSSISLVSCISVITGACITSILSSKRFGKILITALAQGIIYFVILYILGTILFSRLIPSEISPSILLSCFVGALLGAMITALFTKRRRH